MCEIPHKPTRPEENLMEASNSSLEPSLPLTRSKRETLGLCEGSQGCIGSGCSLINKSLTYLLYYQSKRDEVF